MDVDSIGYGEDFVKKIDKALRQCTVLIAVIGHRWTSAADTHGQRRLFNEDDFVRLEIERGLSRKKANVVPVLIDGTPMPTRDELPESLWPLLRLIACRLSHAQFGSDVSRLIAAIREHVVGPVLAEVVEAVTRRLRDERERNAEPPL